MIQNSQKSYIFTISGRVQGVFYRKNIFEAALPLGINGYVKNLPNGKVEAAATLDNEMYMIFLDILKKGSYMSVVDDIRIELIDETYSDGFEIRY